jgi:hypothetical protein
LDRTSSQQRLQQARQQPELLWGCPEKQKSVKRNAKIQIERFKGSPVKGCPIFFTLNFNLKQKEKRKVHFYNALNDAESRLQDKRL